MEEMFNFRGFSHVSGRVASCHGAFLIKNKFNSSLYLAWLNLGQGYLKSVKKLNKLHAHMLYHTRIIL